jgi:hypothetical protein
MGYFQHQSFCKAASHSDAAKKISDTFNLHRIAADASGIENIGKWFAAALEDGSTDGVLYDSRGECVRHQHHNEQWYTFIKIVPSTMTYCEAEVMLKTSRKAYNAGMRLTDPDHRHGGRELIKRSTTEDMLALSDLRATNLRIEWPNN